VPAGRGSEGKPSICNLTLTLLAPPGGSAGKPFSPRAPGDRGARLVDVDARRLLRPPGHARHLLTAAREAHEHAGAGAAAQRLGGAVAVPAGGGVAIDCDHLRAPLCATPGARARARPGPLAAGWGRSPCPLTLHYLTLFPSIQRSATRRATCAAPCMSALQLSRARAVPCRPGAAGRPLARCGALLPEPAKWRRAAG